MPPLAMRSRISYWPKRSGPEDGDRGRGLLAPRGAAARRCARVEAGGGVGAGGRPWACGSDMPGQRVREDPVHVGVGGELRRGGAAGGRGVSGSGVVVGRRAARAAAVRGIRPDSVSRRRLSMSRLGRAAPPERPRPPVGPAAAGGGAGGARRGAGAAGAASLPARSASAGQIVEDVREDVRGRQRRRRGGDLRRVDAHRLRADVGRVERPPGPRPGSPRRRRAAAGCRRRRPSGRRPCGWTPL